MSLEKCIAEYNKLFRQKTGKGKGYIALEMKLGADDEEEDDPLASQATRNSSVKYAEPKVDKSVQALINFIYDKDMMEKSVASVNYDIKKLPLGKLADETVKEGYKYLR